MTKKKLQLFFACLRGSWHDTLRFSFAQFCQVCLITNTITGPSRWEHVLSEVVIAARSSRGTFRHVLAKLQTLNRAMQKGTLHKHDAMRMEAHRSAGRTWRTW